MWAATSLLTFVGGCFPDVEPAWFVTEPSAMGLRARVVEAGPWSAPLSDDPPGSIRAEVMPGDTVRLEAFVVDTDGVADVPPDTQWFQCGAGGGYCNGVLEREDVPDCDGIHAFPLDSCRLGRHDEQPFELAGIDDEDWAFLLHGQLRFGFVLATRPDDDAEQCRRRIVARERSGETVWDCVFGWGGVNIGPHWRFEALLADAGIDVVPSPDEVPPEVAAQEPDFRPVPALQVSIDDVQGSTFVSGSTLELEPGARVRVQAALTEGDSQTLWRYDEREGEFIETEEGEVLWRLASTRRLDGDGLEQTGRFEWYANAADDGGTIAFAGHAPGNRNEAWAWLHLRVASP